MSSYRKLLPTPCHGCIVDVTAYDDPDPRLAEVVVGLISTHDAVHWQSWRGRLQRVRLALRGESYPALFWYSRADLAAFQAALEEAAAAAFGSENPGDTAQPAP